MRARLLLPSLAGAALGLFLGLLVGLAASPVVGTLVGALGAVLAGLFGLQRSQAKGAKEATPGEVGAGLCAAAGFGVAGAIAVLAGLWIRTHDALSPSLAQRAAEARQVFAALGVGDEQARALTVTYLLDASARESPSPKATAARAGETADDAAAKVAASADLPGVLLQRSVLMASESSPGRLGAGCDALRGPFSTDRAALEALANAPAPWPRLARSLEARFADEHVRRQALEAVRELVCAP